MLRFPCSLPLFSLRPNNHPTPSPCAQKKGSGGLKPRWKNPFWDPCCSRTCSEAAHSWLRGLPADQPRDRSSADTRGGRTIWSPRCNAHARHLQAHPLSTWHHVGPRMICLRTWQMRSYGLLRVRELRGRSGTRVQCRGPRVTQSLEGHPVCQSSDLVTFHCGRHRSRTDRSRGGRATNVCPLQSKPAFFVGLRSERPTDALRELARVGKPALQQACRVAMKPRVASG